MESTAQKRPSVSRRISLAAEGKAVAEFTRHVAAALGLGESYLFPTRIMNSKGQDTELEWCADGWTPEGISIWLLSSPDQVELVFGNSLRARPIGVALRNAFGGGDARMKDLDVNEWEHRLHAAVEAALKQEGSPRV